MCQNSQLVDVSKLLNSNVHSYSYLFHLITITTLCKLPTRWQDIMSNITQEDCSRAFQVPNPTSYSFMRYKKYLQRSRGQFIFDFGLVSCTKL